MMISSRSSAAVWGSLRMPKSSMMSRATVETDSMYCLRVPSAGRLGQFFEQDVGFAIEHLVALQMAACPMAWARWLLPVPPGPRNSASSRRSMKAPVARSKIRLRFILGLKLKSKLSSVLWDRGSRRVCGAVRAGGRSGG
jgi:hypothetical protein